MHRSKTCWSTRNELNYIDTLVDGSYKKDRSNHDPVTLLESYIRNMKKRVEFGTVGNINISTILKYAEEKLNALKA